MSSKKNCWEHKNCGREPGGSKAGELGICPAATERRAHGVHGGTASGRACWMVAGTLCGGEVQGTFAAKTRNCMACDFYRSVMQEEGANYRSAPELLSILG